MNDTKTILACTAFALLLVSGTLGAQQVDGSITANGKAATFKHVVAYETDSVTEKGYMDVVVVLSDRPLTPAQAHDPDRLEAMARSEGLAALVVRIDPDAKVMSAAPLHPAFTTFLRSAAFVRWKPSAFDEKRVAGRFWTEGMQNEFRQKWSYDVTFSVPIELDPAAKTVPKK